jgi:hypothetical protein
MKQQTLAMASGFERYTKKTRRALFLEEMEQVVPWAELCALVEPVYAKAGNGRRPVGRSGCCGFTFRSSGTTGPTTERYLGCKQNLGHPVKRCF